jgi:hypothetical protein
MATSRMYAHPDEDLFDDNKLVHSHSAQDSHLYKIQKQARVKDDVDRCYDKYVRVDEVKERESGAQGRGKRRNPPDQEPGMGTAEDKNRKLNDKTIDVGWREVGSMGNVLVVLGAFAAMAWAFSRK